MNSWDKLSERYNTHKNKGEIDFYTADNIFIAWPTLFKGIEVVQPSGSGLRALDFGCGTGGFCEELHKHKYQVVGCDTSQRMINIALANLGKRISFHVGDHEIVPSLKGAPFTLVSSVMVFQFIRDIEKTLDHLDKALVQGGLIAFAIFNPDHVRLNTGEDRPFQKHADLSLGTETFLSFGNSNHNIPVYIRDERDYHALLKARGYTRILVRRPRFTRAFLDKYPPDVDTSCSEYIVMVYKKTRI